MPLYEFELLGPGGHVVGAVQVSLPVESRDRVSLRRKTVPDSVAIAGSTRNPGETRNQVLDAYKRIECRLGNTSEFRRRIGHTSGQVKEAWGGD